MREQSDSTVTYTIWTLDGLFIDIPAENLPDPDVAISNPAVRRACARRVDRAQCHRRRDDQDHFPSRVH